MQKENINEKKETDTTHTDELKILYKKYQETKKEKQEAFINETFDLIIEGIKDTVSNGDVEVKFEKGSGVDEGLFAIVIDKIRKRYPKIDIYEEIETIGCDIDKIFINFDLRKLLC